MSNKGGQNMAIYVWKCQNCDHEQETERPMAQSSTPPDVCDACGRQTIDSDFWVKILKPSSFVLNGGGWYKDGYQKGDK